MSFFDKFKKQKKEAKKVPAKKKEAPKKIEEPTIKKEEKAKVEKNPGKTLGVLVKPLITEKASLVGQYGQYIFEVNPRANKVEIAKAILNAYGVKPVSVNIIPVRGREVRYGRTRGVTKSKKKAIVTLRPGDKIEVHEGV